MIWNEDGKETEEVRVPAEPVPVPLAPAFPHPCCHPCCGALLSSRPSFRVPGGIVQFSIEPAEPTVLEGD